MRTNRAGRILLQACATGALALSGAHPVLAETTQCDGGGAAGSGAGKITAVPFTISAPGVYCVTTKISSNLASGAAITINANNVVLDLNDFAIGNLAAGATTTAFGIEAVDRQNVVVRNGILRGFLVGVALVNSTAASTASSGHLVQNVTSDTSYLVGIAASGKGVRVIDNKVMNTLGANNPTYGDLAAGINVSRGDGGLISGNLVLGTDCTNGCVSGSEAVGILVDTSAGPTIVKNRVMNKTMPTATTSYAVYLIDVGGIDTTNGLVKQNVMANWQSGVAFSSASSGEYAQNGAQAVTTPYNNGGTIVTNGGSNY